MQLGEVGCFNLSKNQGDLGKEPQFAQYLSIAEMVMEKVKYEEIWLLNHWTTVCRKPS